MAKKDLRLIDDVSVLLDDYKAILYLQFLVSEDQIISESRNDFVLKDKDLANNYLLDKSRDLYMQFINLLNNQ